MLDLRYFFGNWTLSPYSCLTMMGPWLGEGACWNRSSDSSSVVLAPAGYAPAASSAGSGGRGGAASEMNGKEKKVVSGLKVARGRW